VELHPLPGPDVLAAQAAGEFRRITHGARTLEQILADASREMDLEDLYADWLAGKPLPRMKRPRKTLRAWLRGRR